MASSLSCGEQDCSTGVHASGVPRVAFDPNEVVPSLRNSRPYTFRPTRLYQIVSGMHPPVETLSLSGGSCRSLVVRECIRRTRDTMCHPTCRTRTHSCPPMMVVVAVEHFLVYKTV